MAVAAGTRRLSRDDWIRHGLLVLGRGGLDAIRVDQLCRGIGVTKGSFYWHFKGREDYLDQLLAAWEERETGAIIARVESRSGSAAERLDSLFDESVSGRVDFALEGAIRHWMRSDRQVLEAVKRVDRRRLMYLEALFGRLGCEAGEAGARAMLFYDFIIGEAIIVRKDEGWLRRRRWEASKAILIPRSD